MPSYTKKIIFLLSVLHFALCTCVSHPNEKCNECNTENTLCTVCNCQQSICIAVIYPAYGFVQPYLRELLILCGDLERFFLVYFIEEEKMSAMIKRVTLL